MCRKQARINVEQGKVLGTFPPHGADSQLSGWLKDRLADARAFGHHRYGAALLHVDAGNGQIGEGHHIVRYAAIDA